MNHTDIDRIRELIEKAGLPTAPPFINATDMVAAMGMDKKVKARKLRFVLLSDLGQAFVTDEYDSDLLDSILEAAV